MRPSTRRRRATTGAAGAATSMASRGSGPNWSSGPSLVAGRATAWFARPRSKASRKGGMQRRSCARRLSIQPLRFARRSPRPMTTAMLVTSPMGDPLAIALGRWAMTGRTAPTHGDNRSQTRPPKRPSRGVAQWRQRSRSPTPPRVGRMPVLQRGSPPKSRRARPPRPSPTKSFTPSRPSERKASGVSVATTSS